jgi:hypothetical protein
MRRGSATALLLKGLTKILIAVCGISFLFGGLLISSLCKMNRGSAEVIGIAIAGVCLILSLFVNEIADRLTHREENLSSNDPT